MKNFNKAIIIGAKIVGLGAIVLGVKTYSKVQYYQGRIDASKAIADELQKTADEWLENKKKEREA